MNKMQLACIKKEFVVSVLLVLAFLSVANQWMFNPAVKAQPSEPTVIGSTDVFGHSYQRYTFYANTRFWAFYSDNTNLVYTTSTDGATWNLPTTVRAASMSPEFSVWFDGAYIHYAKGQKDQVPNTPLYYRMGLPNENGTITWNAAEQIVAPAVENRSYRGPQIIADSNGYPVITYLNRTTGVPGGWAVSVAKSSTKNGTWTNATGFPVVVSTEQAWPFSVPLANGKLYTMWSLDDGKIRGALYNGAFWGSVENSTSNLIGEDQRGLSAVAYGDDVHLAYIENETATKIYRYVKRTYGSGWGSDTVVKNVTGASGDLRSISLTVDQSNGDLWMWFNTTHDKIAYRKYVASTSSWDTNDTYPFGGSFTSPYYITTSYQVRNNVIPTYWQEGTATPYNLLFDYLTVDTAAPTVSVLSPTNQTYAVADVALNFTLDESASWMGYSLDGQANVTVTGNTSLTSLLDGSHSVVVYANDTWGNMGASSIVYFSVDTTSPTVWVLSPMNTTYAVDSVSLTFTVDEAASWMGYSLDGLANVTSGNTTLTSLLDGMHYVVVYANDTVGNMGASSMVYFTVDTTAPAISVLSPENKTHAVNILPLTFTVDETTTWIGYSLDSQANVTITGNTTLPVLSDGSHYVIVYANDTVGNMGASGTVYFTIDTTSPTVSVLSPENRTYAATDVSLTFTVDEATSWMGYSLDGQANVTVTGNTTLTSLLDGLHSVVVYANDTWGNMGASSVVYFTVDTTTPTVSILSPTNQTYAVADVSLTFTLDESASWMGYSLDGQANITVTVTDVNLTSLSDGPHYVVVYANDTVGNMGASGVVYFTIDTVPPSISILSPENKTYRTEDVPLNFTVSESTSWIRYSLDGQANATITGNTTLTGLSEGTHNLIVYASDIAGNTGSSNIVYFTIDTTPPSISIVSPENKTYDTTNIPLTFTVDELVSWIGYSLDSQANVTITGNATLTGLSDGSHSLIVYGDDLVGNPGASGIIYFTIKTEEAEPFPTLVVATIVAMALIGAGLLVYFTMVRKTTKTTKKTKK